MWYPACQDLEKDSSPKREATGPGTNPGSILDRMAGNPGRPREEGGDLGQGRDSTSSQGLTLQGALQIPTLHWVLRVPPHTASFELTNLECVFLPPSQALHLRFLHPESFLPALLARAQLSLLQKQPPPGLGEGGCSSGIPLPAHQVFISWRQVSRPRRFVDLDCEPGPYPLISFVTLGESISS